MTKKKSGALTKPCSAPRSAIASSLSSLPRKPAGFWLSKSARLNSSATRPCLRTKLSTASAAKSGSCARKRASSAPQARDEKHRDTKTPGNEEIRMKNEECYREVRERDGVWL